MGLGGRRLKAEQKELCCCRPAGKGRRPDEAPGSERKFQNPSPGLSCWPPDLD